MRSTSIPQDAPPKAAALHSEIASPNDQEAEETRGRSPRVFSQKLVLSRNE
jgi:hypothetical protein